MNRGGNGKGIFNSMEQIYIDLTEKTASAVTIKSAVQEEWGKGVTSTSYCQIDIPQIKLLTQGIHAFQLTVLIKNMIRRSKQ